ncbi:SDR family NAD(P)-dependent oxidoreductase [Yanghanlia caeni]|uniref:Glucose 1-dehydrogenase n=1 Tax=Yanghanlia caeni TaxID=3064283 RepID=A0ABU1D9N4_9BURK|nr:glucose 1-dehydrogenase [Alcaligenaceae bacterium LG-2]
MTKLDDSANRAMQDDISAESVRRLCDLSGKTAYITGGGGGLGSAIAWGFAHAGADIVLLDKQAEAIEELAGLMSTQTRRKVIALPVDIAQEESVEAALQTARQAVGECDVLVNGAGHNIRKPLVDFSVDEFNSLYAVHVQGAFLTCRTVGARMRERRSGSIINITSITAHVGIENVSAYASAKGALLQMTKTLALEMAPWNVRVNAISPGYIETPLTLQHAPEVRERVARDTPMGRMGRPSEIIGPALFLASESASFVTGASLVVDGGWTAV